MTNPPSSGTVRPQQHCEQDTLFMREAIALAEYAESIGEVPVGAVVVCQGEIVGRGYNRVITDADPSAHAEMMAVREAAQHLQNYRIIDTTLYVTLEPCSMCAGLLVHSRVKRVVFGASDFKAGACGSLMNLAQHSGLNHQLELEPGVLGEECALLLSDFFRQRRTAKKALKKAANLYSAGKPATNIQNKKRG